MCRRMIINAGIKKVIVLDKDKIKTYIIHDWIDEIKKNPFKELDETGY